MMTSRLDKLDLVHVLIKNARCLVIKLLFVKKRFKASLIMIIAEVVFIEGKIIKTA